MKKSLLLHLLLFFPLVIFGQQKNTYSLGYGKPFAFDFKGNHHFFFQLDRSISDHLFLGARLSFMTEEDVYNSDYKYDEYYVILPDKKFALEGIIVHDNLDMGAIQLETRDGYELEFKFDLLFGYKKVFFEKIVCSISGGGGVSYSKIQGLLFGTINSTIDERLPDTHGAMLMEAYKRGSSLFVESNVKIAYLLNSKLLIGTDWTFDYDPSSGAFPITHNIFLGFKF